MSSNDDKDDSVDLGFSESGTEQKEVQETYEEGDTTDYFVIGLGIVSAFLATIPIVGSIIGYLAVVYYFKWKDDKQYNSELEAYYQAKLTNRSREGLSLELSEYEEIEDIQSKKEALIYDIEVLKNELAQLRGERTKEELHHASSAFSSKVSSIFNLKPSQEYLEEMEGYRAVIAEYQDRFTDCFNEEYEVERLKKEQQDLQEGIVRIKAEIDGLQAEYESKRQEKEKELELSIGTANWKLDKLKKSYSEKKQFYSKLISKIKDYQEQFDMLEMGIYEPSFSFGTSERYKEEVKKIRQKQKDMIKDKKAVVCNKVITVDGSEAKGRVLTNKNIRLATRAFNNECDVAIAKVNWNNVNSMEKRINNAFKSINNLNSNNHITISDKFLKLKLEELYLAYELKEKQQTEKEEQAEIRRQEREEQKLKEELAKAEAEEKKLQALLAKVQEKASHTEGEELERLKEEIEQLGDELKAMQKENDRVKAMAEQTKLGYVYVISNIGSFGENIYKIGMTRRLDPMERVKELGSASVPFYFDVHAMIFSEDAPALEAEIQKAFSDKRVNRVNFRKEYFNVTLDEIKEKVWEFNPKVEFVDEIEAREYRESQVMQYRISGQKDVGFTSELDDDYLPDEI